MKKIFALLLILVSMTACQKRNRTFHIDAELQPLYDQYIEAGLSRGRDVSTDDLIMRIEDVNQPGTNDTVLAYCRQSLSTALVGLTLETTETPTIIVDRAFFNSAKEYNLQATISHELTHCLLNQKHKNAYGTYTFKDGTKRSVPTSLMNMYSVSLILKEALYSELKESYLDEIFGLTSSALISNSPELASKAQNLKSDEKIVYESVSTKNGCTTNVSVEHIDAKDEKVKELDIISKNGEE